MTNNNNLKNKLLDDEEAGSQQQQQQRFLLRWHRHAPTITDHLPIVYEQGFFSDVTLSVEGTLFKAHRLILASCSAYFLHIFQEADRNSIEHPYVVLLNAHVDDVKAILNFMYKGECCVYKHRIPDLLATARNLKITGLNDMQLDDERAEPQQQQPLAAQSTAQMAPQQQHQSVADVVIKPGRDVPETCKCFVCGKYLSNQYNLRVHMETHEETYHACNSCPHVSRSRDALRKHMSYRHPDKCTARKFKRGGPL